MTPAENPGPAETVAETHGGHAPAHAADRPATLHVAGLPVIRSDVAHAVDLVWADARARRARVYALVNAYSATLRRSEPAYAATIEDERCIPLADGAALTLGARMVGIGRIERAPGPDVFSEACVRAASDMTPFYLLGGGEGVAEALRDELVRRNPGLRIVGTSTPPYGVWPRQASEDLCRAVRESGAQVLWLGVSAPKQETWALEWIDELGMPVVCVGAAFDFLAGFKPRAPQWMRRAGLEWLFRLLSEPRRLWKRYLLGNTVFLLDLVRFRSNAPTSRD